jgi:small-conductance mechanosensitive channel
MKSIGAWLQGTFGLSPAAQGRIAASLAVILLLWLVRRLTLALVWRRVDDVRIRYRWQKSATYIVVPIGILIVGRIWFAGFGSIATFLGLVSAGVAIALKDVLANVAGWAFILWRRPFELGDRIQIGTDAGDVIDIRLFQFSLLEIGNWVDADQSTGRVVHVPNGKVLTEVTANYSKGFRYIWNELPVLVTFESNWQRAKEILHRIGREHAEHLSASAEKQIKEVAHRFLIFYTTLTPTVYTSVVDSGVLLTLRYLCAPRERRGSAQAVWEAVLTEFAACDDIDFAYPTQRFFDNRAEGKPGTTPASPPAARVPPDGR